MLERCFKIAKVNWKHNLWPHVIVGVLLCVCSPLVMGVENLEESQVAKILELYLSFLGMILLIPLFLPDTNKDVRDLIASKKVPIIGIRIVRMLEALLILVVLLCAYLAALKCGNCQFHFETCFYAAFATCLFQGGLGVLLYSVIDNIALAYMIPFLYYIISMGGGSKYLGKFWLAGYSYSSAMGGNADDKVYLLAAGIIMLVIALWIREIKRA